MGLAVGLAKGGSACIRYLVLRLILYRNGYIPWNYARFLDYAVERIFLQKVGGGYIFVHRLLLEYFATLEDVEAAKKAAVENQRLIASHSQHVEAERSQ